MQKQNVPESEHVTFRIKKNTLEELKSISREKNLSLNTYANHVFESHVNWDAHASEVGWVVMLKSGLTELIKLADQETIIKIATKSAETSAKEICLFMRGKYGIPEWISIIKDRTKMSGFKIKDYRNKNDITLVIHHDMGEKWSLFFMTYYETVFYDLGVKVQSEYTVNSLVLKLDNISQLV